jgi:hypothetical protein
VIPDLPTRERARFDPLQRSLENRPPPKGLGTRRTTLSAQGEKVHREDVEAGEDKRPVDGAVALEAIAAFEEVTGKRSSSWAAAAIRVVAQRGLNARPSLAHHAPFLHGARLGLALAQRFIAEVILDGGDGSGNLIRAGLDLLVLLIDQWPCAHPKSLPRVLRPVNRIRSPQSALGHQQDARIETI